METTVGAQQGRKTPQQCNFVCRHEPVQGEIADDRIERLVRERKRRVCGHFDKVYIIEALAFRRARVPLTSLRLERNKADFRVMGCERQSKRKTVRPDDEHLLCKIGIEHRVKTAAPLYVSDEGSQYAIIDKARRADSEPKDCALQPSCDCSRECLPSRSVFGHWITPALERPGPEEFGKSLAGQDLSQATAVRMAIPPMLTATCISKELEMSSSKK